MSLDIVFMFASSSLMSMFNFVLVLNKIIEKREEEYAY